VSNSAIDDDGAARWAIRLEGEPLSDEERLELEAWLQDDERRRGALLRAEALLAYLDRGRALADPMDAIAPNLPANDGLPEQHYRLASGRRAFVAGGLLCAVGVAGFLAFSSTRPRVLEIETAVGEVRRVPLPDGSVASVNTDSRIAVTVSERRRQVNLENGEAWFQVAADKTRPFVVETGDIRVQAVGTAFSVRKRAAGADVIVTEGVVEAWVVGRAGHRKRISAGSKGILGDANQAIEVLSPSGGVDRELAWRSGEFVLNGESLDYAASELNRYNARKLVIEDRDLGQEQLVGYFRTDQPERFARAVAGMVGARVEIDGDTIRLMR